MLRLFSVDTGGYWVWSSTAVIAIILQGPCATAFNRSCWDSPTCVESYTTGVNVQRYRTSFNYRIDMGFHFERLSKIVIIVPRHAKWKNIGADGLYWNVKTGSIDAVGTNSVVFGVSAGFGVAGKGRSPVAVTDYDIFTFCTQEFYTKLDFLGFWLMGSVNKQLATAGAPEATQSYIYTPPVIRGSVCWHIANTLQMPLIPLHQTLFTYVALGAVRSDGQVLFDLKGGHVTFSLSGNRLEANVVILWTMDFIFDENFVSEVRVGLIGDVLLPTPPAITVKNQLGYAPVKTTACSNASYWSKKPPTINLTRFQTTGVVARSDDGEETSVRSEMEYLRTMVECSELGWMFRRVLPGWLVAAPAVHAIHELFDRAEMYVFFHDAGLEPESKVGESDHASPFAEPAALLTMILLSACFFQFFPL